MRPTEPKIPWITASWRTPYGYARYGWTVTATWGWFACTESRPAWLHAALAALWGVAVYTITSNRWLNRNLVCRFRDHERSEMYVKVAGGTGKRYPMAYCARCGVSMTTISPVLES